MGGLCAGALLARYGKRVVVLESHDVPGGAAHAWRHADGFTFEAGPSLYSAMAARPSGNPIAQVLHALDEPLPVVRYNTWQCHLPEGSFLTEIGNDQFSDVIAGFEDGATAVKEWAALRKLMEPLAVAAAAVPAAAVRSDAGVLLTLARFLPRLATVPPAAIGALLKPYSEVIAGTVTHPFLLRWMDLLCFLLSGAPAKGTLAAEIGYMFGDWYRPGACLEYPVGGSAAIVDALVRGLTKHGGALRLRSHVASIDTAAGPDGVMRASGVTLRSGKRIRASRAVISNASIWDTLPLLPAGALPPAWAAAEGATEKCASFMHLRKCLPNHGFRGPPARADLRALSTDIGIDATGLDPAALQIHHISVEDWGIGVTAPQNLVLVSIPSVLDPGMAPPGCHVIHAYTPGTEPWSVWADVKPGSAEYDALKEARSAVLWRAVEKAIPNVRSRVRCSFVGTPRTHARFLRRAEGSYGGTGWVGGPGAAAGVPAADTPLPGLLCVGDSRFPGPGVPAVAAGGFAAAHALVGPLEQCALLDKISPWFAPAP